MYHYVQDKVFLSNMTRFCADIVNQTKQRINNAGLLRVEMQLVGSGKKNLIVQNENEPVDLDYNLQVVDFCGIAPNDSHAIKEHVKAHFDAVLASKGRRNSSDSTSALSTELMRLKGHTTQFKIDLAILRQKDGCWERLLHQKAGNMAQHCWYWNQTADLQVLADKADALKENPQWWQEVRGVYLDKKNMYLSRNDRHHPSYKVYEEAVNEVWSLHFLSPLQRETMLSYPSPVTSLFR